MRSHGTQGVGPTYRATPTDVELSERHIGDAATRVIQRWAEASTDAIQGSSASVLGTSRRLCRMRQTSMPSSFGT